MKAKLKRLLRLESKFIPFLIVALIIIVVVVPIIRKNNHNSELVEVKMGSIVKEITITGKTKPAQTIDLAFEKSGRVSYIGANVGDKIQSGSILVKLDTSELEANLLETEANLETQQVKLEETKKGSRPEEIEIQEARVQNAKSNLEDSKSNLVDKIADAYTKADDALRNKTDQIFSSPESASPQLSFAIANQELKSKIEWGRFITGKLLSTWANLIVSLDTKSDLASNTQTAKNNLNSAKDLLENISLAFNYLSPNQTLTQTTIDGYKSNASTARTNVGAALSSLTAAEEKLKTAESNLAIAEKELSLKISGSTPEQIRYQEAQVKQAEAKVMAVKAQINKNTLRSPINGIVTKQDAKLGEIVGANSNLVSINSENDLEIEANISEINIENVAIGNPVKITFDAFPEETFSGQISQIDPAETIIDGVVNFKTKISILKNDPKLKSGLTANLEIETGRKDNVLVLPKFLIIEENGDAFVNKIVDGKAQKTSIVIGEKSRDGQVEIISGLSTGDSVLKTN